MTEHSITVARLRELLALLQDDDVLMPNNVFNLTIVRNGVYAGYVDLLVDQPKVELYDDLAGW